MPITIRVKLVEMAELTDPQKRLKIRALLDSLCTRGCCAGTSRSWDVHSHELAACLSLPTPHVKVFYRSDLGFGMCWRRWYGAPLSHVRYLSTSAMWERLKVLVDGYT